MISAYAIPFGQDSVIYPQVLVYMLAKCVLLWMTASVISASATTSTGRPESDPRIYVHGGRKVRPGEYPFLALLQIDQEGQLVTCSGSIPSHSTVLTSAHCDVGEITAYAGVICNNETELSSAKAQVRHVESVTKPQFSKFYDIMICYVNESWVWTQFVGPVALHLNDVRLQPSFVVNCHVLGFGKTRPEGDAGVAHAMRQLIGSSSQCWPLHPFLWFFSFWMCSINVSNKTMCSGDSGGPALCSGSQQWAINMGVAPADSDCVPFNKANVYVGVAYFREWLVDNIRDLPSSADSIQRHSVKIMVYETMLYQPLGLLLVVAVDLLYLQ